MMQDDEILLIDLGDAAYGHPIFDIAMLMLPYIILPNRPGMDDEMRWHFLGFDPALAQNLWGVMCGTYFGLQTPEEIGAIVQRTMPLALFYIAYQGISSGRATPDSIVENVIRPQLIPALEAGTQLKVDF